MNTEAHSVYVSPAEFKGVDCDQLIDVYKQAYSEAGFRFKRQSKQKPIRTLEFDFSIPEYVGKRPAVASFVFRSPMTNDQASVSCYAQRQVFGADPDVYTSEQWTILYQRMVAADQKASAFIKSKLGDNVPTI